MNDEIKCPKCGALEVESESPHTFYKCQSYDYDQRPETFFQSEYCKEQCSANQQPTTEKPSVEGVINHEFSIRQIKNRILEEYQKHPELDWAELAARKIITTQQSEISRLKMQVESGNAIYHVYKSNISAEKKLREMDANIFKDEIERLKAELEEMRGAIKKSLKPENIECDGAHCQGCYKDILRPYLNP